MADGRKIVSSKKSAKKKTTAARARTEEQAREKTVSGKISTMRTSVTEEAPGGKKSPKSKSAVEVERGKHARVPNAHAAASAGQSTPHTRLLDTKPALGARRKREVNQSARRSIDKQVSKTATRRAVTPEERLILIQEAAYFRAERRNFDPTFDLENWVEAEGEIDDMLRCAMDA